MATPQKVLESSDGRLPSDEKNLHDVLSEFSSVLLATFDTRTPVLASSPAVNARPMSIAKLDDDSTLYFITDIGTEKVGAVADSRVAHVFAQSNTRYCSLKGRIEISQDRTRIRELWSKVNDIWFDGPEDPRACLLIVRPVEAELWDVSGSKGIKYLFQSFRALLSGKTIARSGGETHEKLKLREH